MNILQRIKAGSKITKTVDCPGVEDVKVNVKILTEDDLAKASLAADAIYKDNKVGFENISNYNAEVETQQLYRSLKDPETGFGIANNISDFRGSLTPEMKDFFAIELDQLHEENSPDPMKMSDEEFDKLIEDLKKKPEETAGNVTSIYTARKLLSCLASQLSS